MQKKLLNRSFILMALGQFVSRIGAGVWMLVLVLWLKDISNSAAVVGLVVMLTSLTQVLLGVAGGVVSDRYSRKKNIVLADFVNGIVAVAIACMVLFGEPSINIIIALLVIMSIVNGAALAIFIPSVNASVPDLVPVDKVNSGNAVIRSSAQIAMVIGFTSAGWLFLKLGGPVIMLIYGVGYLLSAFSELFIELPKKISKKVSGWQDLLSSHIADTKEGYHFFRNKKGMLEVFFAVAVISFFSSPLVVLTPFFIDSVLGYSEEWYGYLMMDYSLGVVLGGVAASIIKLPSAYKGKCVALFMVAFSLSIAGLGLSTTIVPVLLLVLSVGFFTGLINIYINSAIQLSTPSEVRGRVFGFLGTVTGILIPISIGVFGVIADMLGNNVPWVLLISGIGCLLVSVFLLFDSSLSKIMSVSEELQAQ